MKNLLLVLMLVIFMTSIHAQLMYCDEMDEIIHLEERSWNENKELLSPELFTNDYRAYTGDALTYESFAGRASAIQRTHNEIDNFTLDILDYTCTEHRVITFWKATGTHQQFKIPVKIFGMSMNKIRHGKAYEGVSVHDMLPSFLAAGLKMSGPDPTKE